MSTESIWKQIPEPEDADLSKLLNQILLNNFTYYFDHKKLICIIT